MKKNRGCLGYIGDEILRYVGMISWVPMTKKDPVIKQPGSDHRKYPPVPFFLSWLIFRFCHGFCGAICLDIFEAPKKSRPVPKAL